MKNVRHLLLLFGLISGMHLLAQPMSDMPVLPAMKIETMKARNVITWNCQFEGVKSIAIQRSADSVRNYVTIHVESKVKKGIGSYTDPKPMIGKNYYRLSINFTGDLEWFSNTYHVFLDSAIIAQSIEEAIQTGITKSVSAAASNALNTPLSRPSKTTTVGTTTSNTVSAPPPPESLEFHYTPSARIYTNPYTGHINIDLEDYQKNKYTLRFYTPGKKSEEVLRIGRITRKHLVIDKNNFNSTGTYRFELYNGNEKEETGYITIY